jgi:hypothetical protein
LKISARRHSRRRRNTNRKKPWNDERIDKIMSVLVIKRRNKLFKKIGNSLKRLMQKKRHRKMRRGL